MKNNKRIIVVLTLIFGLVALVQPTYAVDCFQFGAPDPCMPSHHEAPASDSDHTGCNCNPNDNLSSSAGCHRNIAYPRLEMAVIRLDSDQAQTMSNDISVNGGNTWDEIVPIPIFEMPINTPLALHVPIYILTRNLLI